MVNALFTLRAGQRYGPVMLMWIALSMTSAPEQASPVVRFDTAALASFTATATIRRGAGVGRDHGPPPWAHHQRRASVEDAAGQSHPAIITDFE